MLHFDTVIDVTCSADVDVLVLVHTRAANIRRRRFIRKTWASVRHHDGVRVRTVFAIGRDDTTPETRKQIEDDARLHGDVIQFDFVDSYRNMTLKQLSALRWIRRNCADVRMVVKVDDDVLANVYALTSFLRSAEAGFANNTLWCQIQHNLRPQRAGGKWFVTREEYAPEFFPLYCLGVWTIFFQATIDRILQQTTRNVTFLWIDDVFVTGMLRELAGIDIKYPPAPFGLTPAVNVLRNHKVNATAMFFWSEFAGNNPTWTNITRTLHSLANS